jgi:hypothetical protein
MLVRPRPSILALAGTALLVLLSPHSARPLPAGQLPAGREEALATITPDSLRGHLSFLASDLLEGRDTPSRGLDLAAEYIAAQFRRAGLEPAGDDGYFQTAPWKVQAPGAFRFEIRLGDRVFHLAPDGIGLNRLQPLDVKDAELVRVDASDPDALGKLDAAEFEGKVVVADLPKAEERAGASARTLFNALGGLKPALIVLLDRESTRGSGLPTGRLIDPEGPSRAGGLRLPGATPPQVVVNDPAVVEALAASPPGPIDGTATLSLGEGVERPVALRNVVGLLRGSDPKLKDEYVVVSAHYDHIGQRPGQPGDQIFNGANDDGSGTVAVVELASALAKADPLPKRSVLFVTFFGEEKGLLGSRYFGKHPVVPLASIVAHVNLEQVGRTDDREGPQVDRASMTGFDFSDLGPTFALAGQATGVEVFKHPTNSDAFFGRSDNQALADLGIPAHTLCVAYVYPDYHGAGDHWDKIDYDNFARVVKTVGLAVLTVADRAEPPAWNPDNPKAARYLKAWKALHGADQE